MIEILNIVCALFVLVCLIPQLASELWGEYQTTSTGVIHLLGIVDVESL